MSFPGRVLYLTESAELVRRQLAGQDLDWNPNDPAQKLRDNISTDEITPGWVCYYFDETLGRFVYVGLTCEGTQPIGEGDVMKGGFAVSVAGKRRERAPRASSRPTPSAPPASGSS